MFPSVSWARGSSCAGADLCAEGGVCARGGEGIGAIGSKSSASVAEEAAPTPAPWSRDAGAGAYIGVTARLLLGESGRRLAGEGVLGDLGGDLSGLGSLDGLGGFAAEVHAARASMRLARCLRR